VKGINGLTDVETEDDGPVVVKDDKDKESKKSEDEDGEDEVVDG